MTPRAYVAEQLSTIIGVPVTPNTGQVTRFWRMLSREEERMGERDEHGRFRPRSSMLAVLELLEKPPLHADIDTLTRAYPEAPPRWPGGHRFAACLTHDVDHIVRLPWRERWRLVAQHRGRITSRQAWRWRAVAVAYAIGTLAGFSDLATYDYWMAEEARLGFHSTFFVMGEPEAPTVHDPFYRYADPVRFQHRRQSFAEATRAVQAAGWEIGLHGSYASAFAPTLLATEKARLEAMLGSPVTATRQHWLRYDVDATPRAQAHAGFQTDSTLGFNTLIGCRAGLAFPFFLPAHPELLEVPLVIQDVGLLRANEQKFHLPTHIARATALITRIAEVGGVVTLSWHTHPESRGARVCYRALLETIAELGGWGCSVGELDAWWRARRAAACQQACIDKPTARRERKR